MEYAKVAPEFVVRVERSPPDVVPGVKMEDYPVDVNIILERGQATSVDYEILQDIEVVIIKKDSKHLNCILRIENYFIVEDGKDISLHPKVRNIKIDPIQRFGGGSMMIFPLHTWLKVGFSDVFGDRRTYIYGGDRDRLGKVARVGDGASYFYGLTTRKFSKRPEARFPRIILEERGGSSADKECSEIVSTISESNIDFEYNEFFKKYGYK